jgi:hypothetical protein
MCGIYGWQWRKGKEPNRNTRALLATALGVLNDQRGGHSWGWLGDGQIARGLGHVLPHAHRAHEFNQCMAHTRWGTTGAHTVANAHPFEIGDLIGAHNGVLYNHAALNALYKRNFEVDSQHIFQHIVDDVPLDDIVGYGTIEFVRRDEPDVVYLCRLNSSGQLAVAETEHGMVWSSDRGHLEQVLDALGLKYHFMSVEPTNLHYARGGELFVSEATLSVTDRVSTGAAGWRGHFDPTDDVFDLRDDYARTTVDDEPDTDADTTCLACGSRFWNYDKRTIDFCDTCDAAIERESMRDEVK